MDILEKNNKIKKIYIKLGTDCNFHCKYCHSIHANIDYNSNILPILKSMNLRQISFGGGEPLLYWNIIKEIVEYIGDNMSYKIVTNGSLFTQDIVDFCNRYKFIFFISIDGNNSTRDKNGKIKWDLISQLRHAGNVLTIYDENQNIEETLKSLNYYKEKYLSILPNKFTSFPNFVHSTDSTGVVSSYELANLYIKQMTKLLEESIINYKNNNDMTIFLKRCFEDYYSIKEYIGCHCFNNTSISILANGDICVCPYTLNKIGDIFHLDQLDFNKIEKDNMRSQCYNCEIFNICKNYCCKNITDHECHIMKSMHKNMKILLDKYEISYNKIKKDSQKIVTTFRF